VNTREREPARKGVSRVCVRVAYTAPGRGIISNSTLFPSNSDLLTLTYSVCSREGRSVAASWCAVAAAGSVGEDGCGCGVLSLSQPHICEIIAPRDRFILGTYLELGVAACGACGRRAGAVGNPVGGAVRLQVLSTAEGAKRLSRSSSSWSTRQAVSVAHECRFAFLR
jgi:hypothetical protein